MSSRSNRESQNMSKAALFLFSLVLLSFSNNVFAIGIGPGRVSLDFSPNLQTTLSFIVANTGTETMDATLYVHGDLAQYITLDKSVVTLSPKTQQTFTATIALPASISPGTHDIRVGALESQPGEGGTVGARAGVESQLLITAPFSGKIIRATASVENAALGDTITIRFNVESLGNETIDELEVVSTISDSSGTRVTDIPSDTRQLAAGQSATIELSWTPQARGSYTATSKITYDGQEQTIVSNFLVGELTLSIVNISVSPFTLGQIAKVSINVKNEWNQPLNGVYAKVSISDGGQVAESLSRSIKLEPFATGVLDAFIDTANLTAKEYNATAIVYFESKSVQKNFIFGQSTSIATNLPMPSQLPIEIIIVIIVVLIVVAFLWLRKLR